MKAIVTSLPASECREIQLGLGTSFCRSWKVDADGPFKMYLYCMKNGELIIPCVKDDGRVMPVNAVGKVFAEAICDKVIDLCNGMYLYHIKSVKKFERAAYLGELKKPCVMAEHPDCPACKHSYERTPGSAEWACSNFVKKPPATYCYVEEIQNF